ncbi:MAG: Dabb family protein [Nocardioides sp.]
MIRHVVVFRMAADNPEERSRDAAEVRHRLEALVGVVPGVRELVVRPDVGVDGHWDLALVTSHDSREDLATYAADPRHREVIAFCDSVVAERAVVDSDLDA